MILIFETHPVQYRVPLYREVSKRIGPNKLKVVYGSDFSVRAYEDTEFGSKIDWGTNLLSGYESIILSGLRGGRLNGFWSLRGDGIDKCFEENRISAVVLTSLRYAFDFRAYFEAKRRGIPVLLRTETQDIAFQRSWFKKLIRSIAYRVAYSGISEAFPIGMLNARHYQEHGLSVDYAGYVRYSVPSLYGSLSSADKDAIRESWRVSLGIPNDIWLIGFSGKLIPKKDPLLVLRALKRASLEQKRLMGAVIVGAGELESELKSYAEKERIAVWFPGFINQEGIADAYLGMDCLMLPSRQMGETWGLVVNEALQAGCAVILSEYVGSAAEFGQWERVRVIPSGDAEAGAKAINELIKYPHDWNWCVQKLQPYSIPAVAEVFSLRLENYLQ